MDKKIILTGYMASGKTTIAKTLSKATKLPYADLDHVIEKETGKTIAEIFKDEGEIAFRKKEHYTLNKLVNKKEPLIISLGGGTPCYANNHLFLEQDNVISVYLKTSISQIISRLNGEISKRPLLAKLNADELEEYIAKHIFDRSYFYHKAKYTVDTGSKTIEQITNEIVSLL